MVRLGDGTTTSRNTPTQTSSLGTGRTAVAITAGYFHTCALLDDGSVSCWGNNGYGQLGDGTNTNRNTPTQTSSLGTGRTAVAITAGAIHTCAILDDGSVSCWGYNGNGQLGDGTNTDRNTPTQTSSLGTGRTAVAITAGAIHTCAILDDGSVSCWGDNYYGQLGDGTNTDRNTPTQTSSLGADRTAVALTAGYRHTCAILDDGSVSCWGWNIYGGLGDGTNAGRNTPAQTSSLGTDRTAVAITAGDYHTCALLDDGSVSCWGNNEYGQLGDGTTTDRNTPTQTSSLGTDRTAALDSNYLPGGTSQTACAAGTYQASAGQSSCTDASAGYYVPTTGQTTQTECAAGTYQASTGQSACTDASAGYYVPTTGQTTQTACAAGTYQASNGQSSCTDASAGYYVLDSRDHNSNKIASGGYHTCAILDDGSVSCWGYNGIGALGDGTNTDRNTPTQTSSLGTDRTAVAITAGHEHTCALLDDGSVSCWGNNEYGQLGDGTNTNGNTPTQTSSLGTGRTAVAITAGAIHTCAILDDGSVSCWGYNGNGQLGDGTNTDRNTPTQTSSLGTGRTAVAITAGAIHTCAILDDGSVSCWGDNYYGQLGDGTNTDRNTPTQTSSLGADRTAVALTAGYRHTCAILDDGSVSCWGCNIYGRLGDGTNTGRNTPAQTSSLGTDRTAVAITAGDYHTCALLDDGSVSCWGNNEYGQLGDGTNTNGNTPAQTSSLGTDRTAVAITAGDYHTCALLDDGSVSCWGNNGHGQLGDGTNTDRNTPTQTSSLGTDRTAALDSNYLPGGTSQTACAAGTYQASAGQSSCTDASAGYYVPTTGQTTQTECAAGTYQASTGQSACTDASAGYYVPTTGQTTQTACAAGTYQSATGQTSCDDADPGYYVDSTTGIAQTTQTACAVGTYQASAGQSSCTDASAGYYVLDSRDHNSNKIASGDAHTCAILDDGSVSCWGNNYYGQLGDGNEGDDTHRNTPTQISSLGTDRTAVAITAGVEHTCAILDDGSVSCWGYNSYGQLGDGTTTNRNTPTQTSSLGTDRTAVAITAGLYHTCAILDDGSVSCWGYNGNGRLGDGTNTDRSTPTQTSSLGTDRTAVAITAGLYHTCAILDDGSVSCWGYNYNGQTWRWNYY